MSDILQKYEKLPEWLRWIIFIPISFIISVIGWFIIDSIGRNAGTFELVLDILHPAIVQVLFLGLVYYTIPRWKEKSVIIFIILRSLVLLILMLAPIYIVLGIEYKFDGEYFRGLIGEIITLIASISLLRELKCIK